jgi:hypothetical protein
MNLRGPVSWKGADVHESGAQWPRDRYRTFAQQRPVAPFYWPFEKTATREQPFSPAWMIDSLSSGGSYLNSASLERIADDSSPARKRISRLKHVSAP